MSEVQFYVSVAVMPAVMLVKFAELDSRLLRLAGGA